MAALELICGVPRLIVPDQSRALIVGQDRYERQCSGGGVEGLLAEVARFGEATVKHIYGDFTSSASSQRKRVLNRFGIKAVQQFAYTTGKHATDSNCIIDSMDLLTQGASTDSA